MTHPRIPLAGVIGHPIAHSKSPKLHGHWLKSYEIPGHYVPIDVAPDDLEQVLRMMPKMGFVGANVTIPHKERVMDIADQVTDRATLIGAANTLIFLEDWQDLGGQHRRLWIHSKPAPRGAGLGSDHWTGSCPWGRGRRTRGNCIFVGCRRARDPLVQPHPGPGRAIARRFWCSDQSGRMGSSRKCDGGRSDRRGQHDLFGHVSVSPNCVCLWMGCKKKRW